MEDIFNDSEDLIEILVQSKCGSSQKKRERKIKEKWTSQQTEQLVEEVQMRESLWNFLAKDYKDRNLREGMWQEVARRAMQMSRAEVSSKWNNIRCSFRVSLNKLKSTKSVQAAGKACAMNSLHKSLLFLEPTLRGEAPTISNLTEKPDSLLEKDDVEDSMPLTLAASSKRSRRDRYKADEYSNAVECALQTLNTVSKTDIWDDVGNFVSSNGREWETTNPKLANDFKTSIYKTVLDFQVKASDSVHL